MEPTTYKTETKHLKRKIGKGRLYYKIRKAKRKP